MTNGTEMPTEVVFILAFHFLYLNVECYNEASFQGVSNGHGWGSTAWNKGPSAQGTPGV